MVNIPVKYKRKGITIMESRVEQAAERKKCGYNCAQAVACTYCDLAGIDEETVRNLTQGFAAGVGGSMEATCGAVIGAVNILGLINKNPQRTMQGSRKIINRFKEQNGTVICKELKGITDGEERMPGLRQGCCSFSGSGITGYVISPIAAIWCCLFL